MMGRFESIINSEKPVLVDFYADWCTPCKALTPILKEVKGIFGDRLRIIKVDVDHNPEIAGIYGIRSVPTLMLFSGGRRVWNTSGVQPAGVITKIVEQNLLREV